MNPNTTPLPPKTNLPKRVVGLLLGIGWTAGAWLLYITSNFFGPLSFLLPLLLIVGCWLLGRRGRWIAVACLVLVNPLSFFFSTGIIDYYSPHPAYWGQGLPSLESFNLKPNERYFYQGGGCVVHGWEWVAKDSHNTALQAMVAILGWPPHTYHGPYPTQEEALAFIKDAPATPTDTFFKGKVIADGEETDLGNDVPDALLRQLNGQSDPESFKGMVQAKVYQKECLIVRISTAASTNPNSPPADLLILFEKKSRNPFAYFSVSGNAARFPVICPR